MPDTIARIPNTIIGMAITGMINLKPYKIKKIARRKKPILLIKLNFINHP